MSIYFKWATLCLAGCPFFIFGTFALEQNVSEEQNARTTECYIGQYMARVIPEKTRIFSAPVPGVVTEVLKVGKQKVREGEIIAKINEDEIELERKELEVFLLKEEEERKEEINKLLEEKKDISFGMSLPLEERRYFPDTKAGSRDQTMEKSLLELIDKKIDFIKKETEVLREKKLVEFKRKEEAYIIKMPFDGVLQYSFSDKEINEGSIYIESTKEVVTAYDNSSYYMAIVVSNSELNRHYDEGAFYLEIELGSGEKFKGTLSHKKIINNPAIPNSETVSFFFKFEPEKHDKAFDMIGFNYPAKLYYVGDENIVAFNKLELLSLPEAENAISLHALFRKVNPGYELILIGETQILARKK